jgi:hypothetical protein
MHFLVQWMGGFLLKVFSSTKRSLLKKFHPPGGLCESGPFMSTYVMVLFLVYKRLIHQETPKERKIH